MTRLPSGRLDDWNADNADPPAVGQVRLLPAVDQAGFQVLKRTSGRLSDDR